MFTAHLRTVLKIGMALAALVFIVMFCRKQISLMLSRYQMVTR